MIRVTPDISIDEREVCERFVRASGPGGQNVNKVATAVELRFDVARSPSLPEDVRERLILLGGRRITSDGVLTIDSRAHRTQERNRSEALERLIELIRRAAHRPKPRRKTRPTRGSVQRRLASKRRRGDSKRMRGAPGGEE